nr:DUF3265 domain-containing protein [Vibrio parahaemolyticus]
MVIKVVCGGISIALLTP